jgi:rSAM/selenodomain-associated transferase 1
MSAPVVPPCGPEIGLVVFARPPVPGRVKTRLSSGDGGPIEAAALYRAFVADVCARGEQSGFSRRRLYVAREARPDALVDAAADAFLSAVAARHGYLVREQRGDDLGARMDAAIKDELSDGAAGVVLVGSDSPTANASYLREAAAVLSAPHLAGHFDLPGEGPAADLVLGPATDGGYWLVGARKPCPELFAPGIAWGSGTVLVDTLARLYAARTAGLRVHLLPFFYDVDTPADLRLLIAHLRLLPDAEAPETRRALRKAGLL